MFRPKNKIIRVSERTLVIRGWEIKSEMMNPSSIELEYSFSEILENMDEIRGADCGGRRVYLTTE